MENKKTKELTQQVAKLQNRVSNLTDEVAILTNNLRVTQTRVAADMKRLTEQVTKNS
jgi:uncharacterized coiled-coil protein SlyX